MMVARGESPAFIATPTMTKQQAISALILAEVSKGKSIQDAFDAVIGEGAYARLAGELWEALQR